MSKHKYEVNITITVDPTANFLEVGDARQMLPVLNKICEAIYDIDDVEIKHIDISRRKE